jgi:hypothetical protein
MRLRKQEIDYLGVIVGRNQLRMDPKKIQGVADWPILLTPQKYASSWDSQATIAISSPTTQKLRGHS